MTEHRSPYDITQPVRDRHHRMVEQYGEPSQTTPIRPPDSEWLLQDVNQTMRSVMEQMRDASSDTLGGAERIHALAEALNSVTMARCTLMADEIDVEVENES